MTDQPGPETDALVALAMGWKESEGFWFPPGVEIGRPGYRYFTSPPCSTTDDAASMKALEWLNQYHGSVRLSGHGMLWFCKAGREAQELWRIEAESSHPVHALKMAVAEAVIAAGKKE